MERSSFKVAVLVILGITLLSLFCGGCPAKIQYPLVKLSPSSHPRFSDDLLYDGLEHSILKSIEYLDKIPPDRTFQFEENYFTAAHMIRSFEHFLNFIQTKPTNKALNQFIKSHYLVYQSTGRNRKEEVLFTGYYEPFFEGSLNQNAEYNIPVLAIPDDLIQIDLTPFAEKYRGEKIVARLTNRTAIPYFDRREISEGKMIEGKFRQLAWLKDPVDLFFLQIQGSGRIYLDNGDSINVHYHATNGRPYRSIGKLLIDTEKIPRSEMSMQKIREYLNDHPEEIDDVLNYNPSYVFFKLEEDSPLGSLNVKLTPGRSIALDRRIFPLPSLAFITAKKPLVSASGQIREWTDFSRFVSSQDTGGAIRGPGRADLFWGNGEYAQIAAGYMQHTGKLYFLVLKQDVM
jgi:membrane-bound lytic murein transglycosylase A